MIDQQKLIDELTSRSSRLKDTAAKYDKELDCKDIAQSYRDKARVYDEIVADINRGRFKKKEPVVTSFNIKK